MPSLFLKPRARSILPPQPRPSFWSPILKPIQFIDERYARAVLSPLFFAIAFLGFSPEPTQAHILQNAHFKKRIALNCNRQYGKSTIAAILIAHRLFTQPNSLVLIVAPAGRQAGETFLKVLDFLYLLDLGPLHSDRINPHSVVLPNGSRLVSLPAVEGTTRGFSSVSLILFDEASRIKDRIYFAFRPMVAVAKGDLILISTPNGRRGFFYREVIGLDRDANQWFRHTGPVTDCLPRISQDVIDEEQAKGDSYFRQEWLCQFLESAIYAMDELTINNLIKQYVEAYKWL